MPDTAPDEDIFLHFKGFRVHNGDMIGRAERHEHQLAIRAHPHADGLNLVRMNTGDFETHLADLGLIRDVENRDRPADFRRDPEPAAIIGEFRMARAGINQGIGENLMGFGVDPVRHAGGL